MFDPWALTEKHGIPVHRVSLPSASGYTDGQQIWLEERLTDVEARCSLTHELVHISRGHDRHQPPAVEDLVRAQTARLLVPWKALHAHCGAQLEIWHLAQELGVTPQVLADRIRHASAEERCALHGCIAS